MGCEIGFWLILLLALVFRYTLRKERLSLAMLYALPAVGAVLVIFTALDIRSGTQATFAHGLAAAYIGFTLAFGGHAVRWADVHFAHRFAGGPKPPKAPSRGWAAVRHELSLWLRCVVASAVTVVLVELLALLIEDDSATLPLLAWHRYAFGCVVIWFIFGPLWAALTSWRRTTDA